MFCVNIYHLILIHFTDSNLYFTFFKPRYYYYYYYYYISQILQCPCDIPYKQDNCS